MYLFLRRLRSFEAVSVYVLQGKNITSAQLTVTISLWLYMYSQEKNVFDPLLIL